LSNQARGALNNRALRGLPPPPRKPIVLGHVNCCQQLVAPLDANDIGAQVHRFGIEKLAEFKNDLASVAISVGPKIYAKRQSAGVRSNAPLGKATNFRHKIAEVGPFAFPHDISGIFDHNFSTQRRRRRRRMRQTKPCQRCRPTFKNGAPTDRIVLFI